MSPPPPLVTLCPSLPCATNGDFSVQCLPTTPTAHISIKTLRANVHLQPTTTMIIASRWAQKRTELSQWIFIVSIFKSFQHETNIGSGSSYMSMGRTPSPSVWPDWAIYWTLGKFLKPLATINLPKSSTFLGNFYHFSFIDIWRFFFWSHGSLSFFFVLVYYCLSCS